MSIIWKILIGFMIIWLIWYWTGGPQRSTNIKPFLRYDYDSNTINTSNQDLESGAKEMVNFDPEKEVVDQVKANLDNQSMINNN